MSAPRRKHSSDRIVQVMTWKGGRGVPGSIPGPVSSTSNTIKTSSDGVISLNMSSENELKLRRCNLPGIPPGSRAARRPRTDILPLDVNLMLFPIKFVKTCMTRAESPITFLGTSSTEYTSQSKSY